MIDVEVSRRGEGFAGLLKSRVRIKSRHVARK